MGRVLFIVGTRPEAIKLAPVLLEMRRRSRLEPVLCATSQHRDMLSQALRDYGLTADYDLELMKPGQTLASLTARLFERLPEVLHAVKPSCAVVQGDTTTAFAGAMSAFYEKVPVAHVEAGLRTYDLDAPFPEEANRHLIGVVTQLHFAATEAARNNLLREAVSPGKVHVTGNTVIDALLETAKRAPEPPPELAPQDGQRLILVTGHRRESFGEGMRNVCEALARIAQSHPDVLIVYPVHPNPNVIGPVLEILGKAGNVRLPKPVEHRVFVGLMKRSYLVITDSGGVQEEAPALAKPVLVTRSVTERPEGVEAGCARLVGTDTKTIVAAAEELLSDKAAYERMAQTRNPYGDGHASERICNILEETFG